MASQRHKLELHNATATGEIIAEGEIAPGYLLQVGDIVEEGGMPASGIPEALSDELPSVSVPMGPPGGPLQGSSLAGPVPDSIEPPEPPEPELNVPVITGLEPDTAELGSADVTMVVYGLHFTETTIIHFADYDEPTTFIDETQVSTGVKPSLGWGAVSLDVYVYNEAGQSNTVQFTFTEAPPPETQTAKRSRKATGGK